MNTTFAGAHVGFSPAIWSTCPSTKYHKSNYYWTCTHSFRCTTHRWPCLSTCKTSETLVPRKWRLKCVISQEGKIMTSPGLASSTRPASCKTNSPPSKLRKGQTTQNFWSRESLWPVVQTPTLKTRPVKGSMPRYSLKGKWLTNIDISSVSAGRWWRICLILD